MNNQDEKYLRLKKKLDDIEWPNIYLYKFIVKAQEDEKIDILKNNFKDLSPEIYTNISKKGTFISISIKVKMKSAQHVIERYRNLEGIEDIISL